MSGAMNSITTLRGYATGKTQLNIIADEIEAEHEKELRKQYAKGYGDGYDCGFASADDWIADHEDAIAEHGWVKLPVDADGEVIRIGDVMDGYGKTIEVVELRYGRSGWVLISRDGGGYADCAAFAHYHEQTVESTLREFTDAVLDWAGKSGSVAEVGTWSDMAAAYIARLRLAGDGREQQ